MGGFIGLCLLINILRAIDYALVHWAQRKYKTLHGRKARAWAWLNGVRARQPGLFPHWSLGVSVER